MSSSCSEPRTEHKYPYVRCAIGWGETSCQYCSAGYTSIGLEGVAGRFHLKSEINAGKAKAVPFSLPLKPDPEFDESESPRDPRNLAIAIVDLCCGYTLEFAGSPRHHEYLYDRVTSFIEGLIQYRVSAAVNSYEELKRQRDRWKKQATEAADYQLNILARKHTQLIERAESAERQRDELLKALEEICAICVNPKVPTDFEQEWWLRINQSRKVAEIAIAKIKRGAQL